MLPTNVRNKLFTSLNVEKYNILVIPFNYWQHSTIFIICSNLCTSRPTYSKLCIEYIKMVPIVRKTVSWQITRVRLQSSPSNWDVNCILLITNLSPLVHNIPTAIIYYLSKVQENRVDIFRLCQIKKEGRENGKMIIKF